MTTKIIGTGSFAPENIVTNDDLSKIVDTNDEWIRTRTGIKERHITNDNNMGTSYISAQAAKRALENANINAEDIDIIILATSSADQCFPSGACEVQKEIGAINAVAYDISAACTGFVIALNTVHSFIKAGIYKTGLVIGAETLSKLVDWSDRSTCVLFGDGAGAAVVQSADEGIVHMVMKSDGTRGHVLGCKSRTTENFLTNNSPELGYVYMDGQEVFKFAVKQVPECITQLLEESNTGIEEIKYFIMHQANDRIFESIAKRINVSVEKMPTNIDRYGNTSAASIPIILDEMNRDGKLDSGDKIIFVGFGGGLSWGATLINW